jgi:hypothetical protein
MKIRANRPIVRANSQSRYGVVSLWPVRLRRLSTENGNGSLLIDFLAGSFLLGGESFHQGLRTGPRDVAESIRALTAYEKCWVNGNNYSAGHASENHAG